ncbi:MAG: TraR/DksA family transcriptional regulator [Ktedonobacteraceae bacterium]
MTLDLKKIRTTLETRRDEIRQNLATLTEAHPKPVGAIEANDGAQEFEDNAVDFLELQQEQSIQVNEQALLTEIEQALERLDKGTYGKCVVCGQPIPEKRLEAIPWAARCIKDEEQLEQRNLSATDLYDAQLE